MNSRLCADMSCLKMFPLARTAGHTRQAHLYGFTTKNIWPEALLCTRLARGNNADFQTSAASRGRGGPEMQWAINTISGISSCSLSGVLPDQDNFPHRIDLTQDFVCPCCLRFLLAWRRMAYYHFRRRLFEKFCDFSVGWGFHFICYLIFHTPEFLDNL